jgi:invasion protein IalB
MKPGLWGLFAGVALALATASASLAQAPAPQGTVKSKHGAWSIVCDTPAGATAEQCAMMQNVVAEDRPEIGLSVVVLRTADNKAEILRVLAPLGVLLPNGLGLNVDGKDIGRAYFVRCFQDGCYAEVILEKPLLDTLKAARPRPSSCSRRRKKASAFRWIWPASATGLRRCLEACPQFWPLDAVNDLTVGLTAARSSRHDL